MFDNQPAADRDKRQKSFDLRFDELQRLIMEAFQKIMCNKKNDLRSIPDGFAFPSSKCVPYQEAAVGLDNPLALACFLTYQETLFWMR